LKQIYFIQSEELIEHDDYYDLYKQELHKLMQDEMAMANKAEPVVNNKMLRQPKKFNSTSVGFVYSIVHRYSLAWSEPI
jgi:hypothetical protein